MMDRLESSFAEKGPGGHQVKHDMPAVCLHWQDKDNFFIPSVAVTKFLLEHGSQRSLDSYGLESYNPQVLPACFHLTLIPQHVLLQLHSTAATRLAAK